MAKFYERIFVVCANPTFAAVRTKMLGTTSTTHVRRISS